MPHFDITAGVLQEEPSMPYIFISMLDYVMRIATFDPEEELGFMLHPQ